MKTTVYYFSGTGNSLQFAKQLASELDNCELLNMAGFIHTDNPVTTAGCIGLVFPVYAWGAPRIVLEFIEKLNTRGSQYFFSVTTCMGIAANTLRVIQGKLKQKGTDLHAGFVVKAPCSSLMKMNTLDKIVIAIDRQRKKLLTGETRLKEIAETVRRRKPHKPETSSPPANLFGSLFHDYGINFFKTADKDFRVSQNCNGCGICVSVCPRENVAIENGKPVFSANCEFCHSCVQWCPQFAITHPNFDDKLHQYRNPHVRWKELVVLKKQNVS